MSVLSVQNLQETFVGKNISRTATPQVINPNAPGYIADGEVVIVNSSGAVATTAITYASSPWIQIVQRNGDNLVWSPRIFGNKVTGYRGKINSFGQEQIYHIGYNGSANSLDINSGLDFQLTLIENQDDMMWSEQKKKNVVYVPSNLVTTQLSLASAIVKNQMKKYTTDGSSITAMMLNNSSTTGAAHSGASTAAVVHGSPYVIYTSGGNVVSPSNISAGVVIRLGSTGSGRSNTIGTYTVKEIQGTGTSSIVVLDQPYAGPSNSALPDTDHGVVTTVGTNWGVRFTGKQLPFRRDFFKFKRVSFTLQMSGFGTTILTKTQESSYGNGDGRLVLEEESFSKGFEGALNRMTVPLPLANETFTADGSVSSTAGSTAVATSTINAGSVLTTGVFATITTTAAHGLVTGQTVVITTATPAGYNGTYQIVNVPSATTFTIANATTGNITVAATITPSAAGVNGDVFPVAATNYSALSVEFFNQDSAVVTTPPAMPQLAKIFIPSGAGQGGSGTSAVQAVLNTWMALVPGAYSNQSVL